MIKYITLSLLMVIFVACNGNNKQDLSQPKDENLQAKELLQGVWLDDETDSPLMYVTGDTIYYAEPQSVPVYFKIINDSLYTHGNELTHYKIDRQTEHLFSFHSISDNIVKLYKSEDPNDTLSFVRRTVEMIPTSTEVMKKDSVVVYGGTRYRAYVYINPSKKKVVKTSYSEDGIGMDNVYYDNVMHICIYEGRQRLYASDITKQMFEEVIPAEFLSQSLLSDMNFMGIDSKGYHYQATLCLLESSVCNVANLTISFDGELKITVSK